MFDELSHDKIIENDLFELYRVQVFCVIFDLLSVTIGNRVLKVITLCRHYHFLVLIDLWIKKNNILTFYGDNEKVVYNFCKMD